MRSTERLLPLGPLALVLWVSALGGSAAELSSAASTSPSADPMQEASPADVAELLPNAIEVEEGLLAGGQPSTEQLVALREAGYLTVINLRTDGEGGTGQAEVEAAGMTYVTLPIAGAAGLSEDNARNLAQILADVERPAVVHCGSGNRVGGLLALKAYYVDGASPEEALQYGLESGLTSLEAAVREYLEQADAEP